MLQVLNEHPYGPAFDWWSLGVLIYEMLVGRPPFEAEDEDQLFDDIVSKSVHYPRDVSSQAKSLLQQLLQKNPSQRWAFSISINFY